MSDPSEDVSVVSPEQRLEAAIRSRWPAGATANHARHRLRLGFARGFRRLSEEIALLGAKAAVRDFVGRRPGVDEALTFAYTFDYGGFDTRIAPTQIPSEIDALARRVGELRPRTVLEIGTNNGGTLLLFATVAADDALLVSVDLPLGPFGGGYAPRRGKLYRSFASAGQRIELIRGDSHDQRTFEAVARLIRARGVDLLFVDGDHSYGGVKSDFEMYAPLVAAGGLVVLHDIVPGSDEHVGGVPAFWKELAALQAVDEFVESWDQGGFGLGLLTRSSSATTHADPVAI